METDYDDGICYWDSSHMKLVGSRISKIRAFLKKGLIKQQSENIFDVLPDIEGGRHTTHTVDKGTWSCTCQAYDGTGICSHILAVRLYLQQRREGGRQ